MEETRRELLERLKGIIADNEFANYIGMELLDADAGYARARIRLKNQYKNIYGNMHGGCAFTLADTLAGIAVVSFGDVVTTLNASVNYMKPVANTEYLYCDANVKRHGGKVSVVQVELTNDNGELLINGSFTYYHIKTDFEIVGF